MKSTISIALATRNGERYLKEQLNSIKEQTLPPFEVVVSDDHSSDNTVSILKSFQKDASFPVRICDNKTVQGSQKNFVKAISLCEGSIIKLCDQDDYWERDYLEKIAGIFESNSNFGLVITNAEVVDQDLKSLGFTLWDFSRVNRGHVKHLNSTAPYRAMLKNNIGYGFTLAFASHFTPYVSRFPRQWSYDGWIAMTISALARVGLIHEPLVKYRQHEGQQKPFRVKDGKKKPGLSLTINQEGLLREINLFQVALLHYQENNASDFEPIIKDLQSKILHLKQRLNLPSNGFGRLTVVLKEGSKGNYHRYLNGYRAIVKDLLG